MFVLLRQTFLSRVSVMQDRLYGSENCYCPVAHTRKTASPDEDDGALLFTCLPQLVDILSFEIHRHAAYAVLKTRDGPKQAN